MKKFVSILALLLCLISVQGQNQQPEVQPSTKTEQHGEERVYDAAEEMPSFPGGMGALKQYLSEKIKYPKDAEEKGIQGRVLCTFVVKRDGSITDVKVYRSVAPSLDAEAVRVIQAMPRWIPGKQDGKPCRVKFMINVNFKHP